MKISATIIAAVAVLLAACGGGDNAAATGKISIAVTDGPVDNADAVVVTFTEVQLLSGDDSVRQSFAFDTPQQIDLLSLQGTLSTPLVDGESIPVGTYDQVRLIVDAPNTSCQNPSPPFASYITIDGTDFPLAVPSGGESGLKVNGPLTVAAGGTAAYTIDFDLRKSVAQRGSTDCYNLRPVLRVVDNAEVGSLQGTVDGDLLADASCSSADTATGEGVAVYLYGGADVTPVDIDGTDPEPLTTANVVPKDDQSGDFSYEVGFLLAGDYTAALTCQAALDDPEVADEELVFAQSANVVIDPADTPTVQDFLVADPPAQQ